MSLEQNQAGGAFTHRRLLFVTRSTRFAVLASLLLVVGWLDARQADGRPAAWIPEHPEIVIERLPRGYASVMPTRDTPIKLASGTLQDAQRLLSVAAETGDARLAARASGILDNLADTDNSDLLRVRAFNAQHQHDFSNAVVFLERAIAVNGRDADARLARAQIELVRGNLDEARTDCVSLALGLDSGRGMLCVAALALRRGQYQDAAKLSDRWLSQAPANDPSRRYALVQRGEIASRSGDPGADAWFRQALALAPLDVRTLSAFSRHLRAAGRYQDMLVLLKDAPETDGIALHRTIAMHALGTAGAKSMLQQQARRYRLARALGSEPELRDEAELLLLSGDPRVALRIAKRNFASQRDHEDVDVLVRAAHAAHEPRALDAVREWATSQQIDIGVHKDPR